MNLFTLYRRAAAPMVLAFALCAPAKATDILNFTTSLTTADPTQLGRLSRNSIAQDWVNTEPFPGVVNPTVAYHYRTFQIDPFTVSLGPFIQISLDDSLPNLFASAYFTSYNPNSAGAPNLGFDTHWLGDAGASGNFFGVDPVFFQVTVPIGASLVVVINNTGAANLGVGETFNLLVESFSDTNFTPARVAPAPSAVPEPSAYGLFGAGMLAGLSFWRRQRNRTRRLSVERAGRFDGSN
jgi:PEP-CTERM motif